MNKSPDQSPLRQENDHPTASRPPPPQKTTSSKKETYFSKAFGFPLRSLLHETEDPIPPPPTGELSEAPASNSPLRSPVRRSENQAPAPIPQTNREASFPASPLNTFTPASQQPLSNQYDSASKSPAVATQHQSVLEDVGSPMLQPDRSPEKPAVANRMEASAVAMAAKVGGGEGAKRMRVESGVLRWGAMRRAEVGLRVLELVLCMVSFSVMAADKTSGWAGDSFDRYQEFRYCVSMNVIAFVYSVFQVYAHFHRRIMKRRIVDRPLSYYLDFSMDQVLAYLLMSASSSAAARNDDWISMFGNDEFTDKMKGSIAMSFLAFFAFALSSIISADKLFSWNL